ncbi:Hpt domain-containing protein [Salidesulfovibrio onnuriiensis]|uniref:Hpt domain-containing protein n=1 Tax=Salidesulfovibrio onnuriiensis TaxID=2583823 RepID=UPI0011CC3D5D|nr:Hpt domain-containing protein [Salidesulfovibrio onnuriiensis]
MLRDISRKYYADEFELDTADVEDLINEALVTLQRNITVFEKLFADGNDRGAIREAAHAIKGNLLNMGLDDQAQLALDIELNAETDLETARERFSALKKELERF